MSWAQLASKQPSERRDDGSRAVDADSAKSSRVAVLDANALISSASPNMHRLADRFYTIQEVLDEIRDKQSRQFLQALPLSIEVKDYSEDSLRAVSRFAKETGDIHALSAADLKLLALCHTLEVAAHGSSHLREHPMQAAMRSKHRSKGRAMPGWGNVTNPEEWKVVDEAAHDTPNLHGTSRIRSDVQSLEQPQAGPQQQGATNQQGTTQQTPAPPSEAHTAPAAFRTFGEAAAAAAAQPQTQTQQQQQSNPQQPPTPHADLEQDAAAAALSHLSISGPAPAPRQGTLPQQQTQQQGSTQGMNGVPGQAGSHVGQSVGSSCMGSSDEEDEEEDGWATAGKSRNAERRKHRKHLRWLAREEARARQARAEEQERQQRREARRRQKEEARQQRQQAGGAQGEGVVSSSESDSSDSEGEYSSSEESSDGEQGGGSVGCKSSGTGASQHGSAFNLTSNVLCVTSDFPMQNVLLQMGLRLMALDGRQITRVSRWALRCVACFFVTKEAGRIFCPRCGNAALERVEVQVSPEGTEFFGVKKKHVLRGTRYSLPKPKGGRAGNPILREDQMLKKVKRRNKQADATIDPFDPEFGNDTWHVGGKTQAGMDPSKGAAFLLASWKHNPNERRSNRNRR